MPNKEFDCVIVANGEFPQKESLLDEIRRAPYVIACDGAINKLMAHHLIPDIIVGDLDSLSSEVKLKYAARIFHNPDQETNDLTKATNFAHQKGFQKILILGATGLREDHTLGNISLLCSYQTQFESVCMMSDYGIFIPINNSCELACEPGQQVSIFNLSTEVRITSGGLRYPIANRCLQFWWEGTLNEALEHSFTLKLSQKGCVIVYLQSK